jgi:branched-chain amino acid transport system permease protein
VIGLPFDDFAAVFVNQARVVSAVISVAATAALYWFITRARLGKALRAAADNPEAAIYMGIDVDRAHRIAFGIGTGVTAIAGGLVATYYPFQPYVGLDFVIIMYAGVVLGGMGSITGAFWGGMTIGLVQQLSALVLPFQLQNVAIFVVFLLIVLVRPQGLYGRSVERT